MNYLLFDPDILKHTASGMLLCRDYYVFYLHLPCHFMLLSQPSDKAYIFIFCVCMCDFIIQCKLQLARQSSEKDESSSNNTLAEFSFAKQDNKIAPNKINLFQRSSHESKVQVFKSISTQPHLFNMQSCIMLHDFQTAESTMISQHCQKQ